MWHSLDVLVSLHNQEQLSCRGPLAYLDVTPHLEMVYHHGCHGGCGTVDRAGGHQDVLQRQPKQDKLPGCACSHVPVEDARFS